jgi:hypothetical protein
MGDTLQYRRVVGLEYSLGNGEIKINMDGTNDDYYSNVDEVQINPSSIDLNNFQLDKEAVTMHFSKPIICNINSGKYHSSMKCGAKFEGKESSQFVERLEDLADRIEFLIDESVEKKKEEIQSRRNEE